MFVERRGGFRGLRGEEEGNALCGSAAGEQGTLEGGNEKQMR